MCIQHAKKAMLCRTAVLLRILALLIALERFLLLSSCGLTLVPVVSVFHRSSRRSRATAVAEATETTYYHPPTRPSPTGALAVAAAAYY